VRVVTFYSYKGGVGRTQALVNVAAALERAGKRVLLVDFDLEAPGLDAIRGLKFEQGPGLVELIHEYLSTGVAPEIEHFVRPSAFVDPVSRKLDIHNARFGPDPGAVLVLPSGNRTDELAYKRQLASIDFGDLYARRDGYLLFEDLRCQWRDRLKVDYVLIDSRTGHTDVGGICVRQLPDHVVLMFYPNEQNFQGIESIAAEARADARSLEIDAVMSRVPFLDDYEQHLLDFEVRARRKLRVPRVYRIHSYESIHIVRDEVFLADGKLDRTRLSTEYRKLVRAIVTRNIDDRSAVLETLKKGLPRVKSVVGSKRSGEWTDAVRSRYRGDDSVLEGLAAALRRAGEERLEGEVQMDLAKARSSSAAAKDWMAAQSLAPSDPAGAVRLAAKAIATGDELALSSRLDAFLLLCRHDQRSADHHAKSICELPVEVEWVEQHWDTLSRSRGGLRVVRTVLERGGYQPKFGPGEQFDLLADGARSETNDPVFSERLAVAMVSLGPTTAAMQRYADDRICENIVLKTRSIHALPAAPFRSDAEFGSWIRFITSQVAFPGVGLDQIDEIRAPCGLRNAEEVFGIEGSVDFGAVPMTHELCSGIPPNVSLEVAVRAGIATALSGDTEIAKSALQRVRDLRAECAARGNPDPWMFNCWQMLNRPLAELEQDLDRIIQFHDSSEEVRKHAGERLFMRPPFLDEKPCAG
jgi:hypothetical protein